MYIDVYRTQKGNYMKYNTKMNREDMIDYVNELEARLESPENESESKSESEADQNDSSPQIKVKVFNSHEDLIEYQIKNGLIDIPAEHCCKIDEECSDSDCDSEMDQKPEPDGSMDSKPDIPMDKCEDSMDVRIRETVYAVLALCKYNAKKRILSHGDISALSTLISTVKGYNI